METTSKAAEGVFVDVEAGCCGASWFLAGGVWIVCAERVGLQMTVIPQITLMTARAIFKLGPFQCRMMLPATAIW